MARRDDIYRALRACVDPADRLVILHSALFAFRTPAEGLKWDVLAALRRLLSDGITLALPAVTFSYCRTGRYHHRLSRPETGVLVEWFLEAPEARRTPHPVYSFAVAGPLADELTGCRVDRAFGAGTVFEVFERHDARIVMLGAGWSSCTQVHRYEELAAVPYRHEHAVPGEADFGAGPEAVDLRMVVRDTALDSILDFSPLFDLLREQDAIRSAPLLGGTVESVGCADLHATADKMLGEDPYALVRTPRVIEHRVRQSGREPVRLAVLGSRTMDVLARCLRAEMTSVLGAQPVEVYTPAYGQPAREVLDPSSRLYESAVHAAFFADRLEDVLGVGALDEARDDGSWADAVDRYAATVLACADLSGRPVFVNCFTVLQPAVGADLLGETRVRDLVAACNQRLVEALGGCGEVRLVDVDHVHAGTRDGAAVDDRLWLVGRIPYSASFSAALARRYCGLALAATGRTARLIVVDLDNTLWHGTVGDDGFSGIGLGPDYPGNAHLRLQRVLRELRNRGVALAACSKNQPETALRVLREHPAMLLREEDFAAIEIGWRPKWQALIDIAGSVNLGLESVLFVDDNPVEREHVRRQLPQVTVLDLPEEPAEYAAALLDSPLIAALGTTDSDRRRADGYRVRSIVEVERARFDRPEDFYASLDTRLHVAPLAEGNLARAEQLCLKTNQFNVTGLRYGAGDLRRLAQDAGHEVIVLGLADRFSEHEDIGLLIVKDEPDGAASIDSYLLSCRVLGRGVEAGVLAWLADQQAARGCTRLRGRVVPTERNSPCRGVFEAAGFTREEDDATAWSLRLDAARPKVPTWLTVADHRTGVRSGG